MAETFGQIWQRVALHASTVPPLLCREWTKDAYVELCTGNRWSFTRRMTRLVTQASRTAAGCTVTKGSPLVTGTFQATDLNRQIRSGNSGQPYTIVALNGPYTQATLDMNYTGVSGTIDLTILDAFLYMPADFDGLYSLNNLTVQQPMPWWYAKEQLDYWDPNRIWQDSSARLVAARGIQQDGSTVGRVVYEWWPHVTAIGEYDMTYYAKPDPLDEDELQGSIAGRSNILMDGALAQAANYPGTKENPNPYFNPSLALRLEKKFNEGVQALSVRDDDIVPGEQYNAIDWRWVQGLVPMDTRLLRSSDATLADYYAGGPGAGYY
jgi:hypothetical protein